MNNNFSKNLRFLRKQKGWTQEELGQKIGKDYSTIGKWELGHRFPVMLDVMRLSELFAIDPKDLISSDLRINASYNPTEEDYKRILKEKGLMDNEGNIKKEDFERLIKFADVIKEITKKEEP